jgi:hypothetical protein
MRNTQNITQLYVAYTQICTNSEESEEEYGSWSKEHDFTVNSVHINNPKFSEEYNYDFNVENIAVPVEVKSGDVVYVLSITYSDGDSFGSSSGEGEILYVFKDKVIGEAAEKIWGKDIDHSVNFQIDDGSYLTMSNPSYGYFSNVCSIDLIEFTVED